MATQLSCLTKSLLLSMGEPRRSYVHPVYPERSMAIALLLTTFSSLAVYCKAQFVLDPVSVTQAEGVAASFECQYAEHPLALTRWIVIINGTVHFDLLDGVLATPAFSGGASAAARLVIPATSEYNNTVVQCEAFIQIVPAVRVLSKNATLQVQGPLQSVSNLRENSTSTSVTISWDPPFSLNLTTAEPDVQYCVDVYSLVPYRWSNNLLQSVCDITETSYTFLPSNGFHSCLYFTVTPRSNLRGSLNGTTSEPIHVHGHFSSNPLEFAVSVTSPAGGVICMNCSLSSGCLAILLPFNSWLYTGSDGGRDCSSAVVPEGVYCIHVFAVDRDVDAFATVKVGPLIPQATRNSTSPTTEEKSTSLPESTDVSPLGAAIISIAAGVAIVLLLSIMIIALYYYNRRLKNHKDSVNDMYMPSPADAGPDAAKSGLLVNDQHV